MLITFLIIYDYIVIIIIDVNYGILYNYYKTILLLEFIMLYVLWYVNSFLERIKVIIETSKKFYTIFIMLSKNL